MLFDIKGICACHEEMCLIEKIEVAYWFGVVFCLASKLAVVNSHLLSQPTAFTANCLS